jgi:hypothetical protein
VLCRGLGILGEGDEQEEALAESWLLRERM